MDYDEIDRIDDELIGINDRLNTLVEALKGLPVYIDANQKNINNMRAEWEVLSTTLNLLIGTIALNMPSFLKEFTEELEGFSTDDKHSLFQTLNYSEDQIFVFNVRFEGILKFLSGVAAIQKAKGEQA